VPRPGGGVVEGVADEAPPPGRGVPDTQGRVAIGGDLFGRFERDPAKRSRWMLVEVEVDGETRFEVVYALDVNLAYGRGAKYGWTLPFRFEDLLVPGGPLPSGR
jgi:hypothetical protein